MAVVRAVLLVVAGLLVTAVSMLFVRDSGLVEKLVLVVSAVLLALVVPRIQRLGTRNPVVDGQPPLSVLLPTTAKPSSSCTSTWLPSSKVTSTS